MFIYFSCIRTIPFLLIDINCVWYFSASLSLSVSLLMAPKKSQFTLARNLLRFGASFSSFVDPYPSHVRFHDDKACKDFSENFSRHGIHSEHQVIVLDFFDIDLPAIIYSRGRESLCDISVTCPSVIIQEFYSNMHEFDYSVPHFITRVRGMRVVTLDLIFEVLHILRVEFANYPSCPCLRIVSKDELSSLFCETPSSWGDC